jgi:ketosteroid isomerase-like protein
MIDVSVKPSSRELIESFFRRVDQCDWAAMMNLVHEQVIYERPGYPPLEGRSAFIEFYQTTRIISDGQHIITQMIGSDDFVACMGEFRGRSRAGDPLEADFADFYRLLDGLIVERRTYFYAPLV